MPDHNTNTIPGLFLSSTERFGDRVALRQKTFGIWRDITWKEYKASALAIAHGLAGLGLIKGDYVGIIGENCPEWLYIDVGIQLVGAVSVGVYTTNSIEQCEYVIKHADCSFLFLENEEQLDKWLAFRERTPLVKKVIVWDWKGLDDFKDDQVISLAKLMEIGHSASPEIVEKCKQFRETLTKEDTSVLIYTSGTTGPPKGAMLSHQNLTWTARALSGIDETTQVGPRDEVMSFLPLCHIFERMFSLLSHIYAGYIVNFVESPDTIADNLREISPTVGYAVPRIWEKYHARIKIAIDDASPLKKWLANKAVKHGEQYIKKKIDRQSIGVAENVVRWLYEHTVYWKIRKHLGMERMRFAFSGAAPIAPDILLFFNAIGLNILEGYGMTESCGITSGTRLETYRFGTVGLPLDDIEVKLSEEGEIMIRSDSVFKGYFKNQEATDKTIQEGWLYTGDIGEIDETGHIKITDRKKDIIITAGGKNIAPQYIENKLKCSSYINDAIVVGEQRKFVSALIVLDEENINKYAQDQRVVYQTYADLASNEAINALISKEINEVNKDLSRVESVKKFAILPKRLYQEDGDVTPTMKVKRNAINDNYSELIESMYT